MAAASSSATAPPAPMSAPRLVLHFDVNETILVGDEAGGDTFEAALNKVIAKSVFVRAGPDGKAADRPLRAADGTAVEGAASTPPMCLDHAGWPEGCVSYYRGVCRTAADKKAFTEPGNLGEQHRPALEELERALRWRGGAAGACPDPDPRLCHDGVHHLLLPAFFVTLAELAQAGRAVSVVVRTFGSDTAAVLGAIRAFGEGAAVRCADGRQVPAVPELAGASGQWAGRYAADGSFSLRAPHGQPAALIEDEEAVVRLLEWGGASSREAAPRISVTAIQDDYDWWSGHGWAPSAGKPLWVTESDESALHIFFDDNIHPLPDDSIVAVRSRPSPDEPFRAVGGAEALAMHGTHLIRVPTAAPILDERWFLDRIGECEAKWRAQHA